MRAFPIADSSTSVRRCGKHRYPDKRAALTMLNSTRRLRGRHGRAMALRAYHCEDCGGWHLTKQV